MRVRGWGKEVDDPRLCVRLDEESAVRPPLCVCRERHLANAMYSSFRQLKSEPYFFAPFFGFPGAGFAGFGFAGGAFGGLIFMISASLKFESLSISYFLSMGSCGLSR